MYLRRRNEMVLRIHQDLYIIGRYFAGRCFHDPGVRIGRTDRRRGGGGHLGLRDVSVGARLLQPGNQVHQRLVRRVPGLDRDVGK